MNREQAVKAFKGAKKNLYRVMFDLEATCSNKGEFPQEDMEVIEVGAVLVDPYGEVAGTFQGFIKPVKHPKLTDFCTELTTITQDMVENARTFEVVEDEFCEWVVENTPEDADVVYISWGEFDKNILKRQSSELGVNMDYLLQNHQNGKKFLSLCLGTKRQFGVSNALKHFNMEFVGVPHRALSDAMNVKLILDQVIEYNFKPVGGETV